MNYYPTKQQTRTIIIRSNSPNLTQHNQSDVTFSLPETLIIPPNAHALISVTQATIPCTFWMVDDDTDKIVLSGTTYTLTHGNYNIDTMTSYLNTLLTGYTITSSDIQNKITISHTNSFTIDASSTILDILGFTTTGVSATSHTGDDQVDFAGVKAIDVIIKGLHSGCINTNFKDDGILARIPIEVPQADGGIQQYHPAVPPRLLLPNFTIDELRIVLADEDGDHSLHFHGGIWTVVIAIEITHSPRDPKFVSMQSVEKNIRYNKKNKNEHRPQNNEVNQKYKDRNKGR